MEAFEVENGAFWTGKVDTTTWGSVPAIEVAIEHVRALGGSGRIGIEFSFMPADAASVLRDAFPGREIVDAHFPLERLRAVKTVSELEKIRQASERVVDAMRATFDALRPGLTKHAVVDLLRRHEIERELEFEYCLISAGTSLNRAPSDQVLRAGDILTLDSGGRFEGYVGDLCRMGILGEPDAELEDLLAEVEAIQQAARLPVRAGTPAEAIYAAAEPLLARSAHREVLEFVAHGVGLITHEAPRISATAPVPYAAYDAKRPLAAGMVLSVETTLAHRRRGMIKLEDTLCVTEGGCVSYGDGGRGWNKARGAAPGPR
jgi:Xaa-Pro aminopeptidase